MLQLSVIKSFFDDLDFILANRRFQRILSQLAVGGADPLVLHPLSERPQRLPISTKHMHHAYLISFGHLPLKVLLQPLILDSRQDREILVLQPEVCNRIE